jgi:hypothetical protein
MKYIVIFWTTAFCTDIPCPDGKQGCAVNHQRCSTDTAHKKLFNSYSEAVNYVDTLKRPLNWITSIDSIKKP